VQVLHQWLMGNLRPRKQLAKIEGRLQRSRPRIVIGKPEYYEETPMKTTTVAVSSAERSLCTANRNQCVSPATRRAGA
jgi:hypothetical protein